MRLSLLPAAFVVLFGLACDGGDSNLPDTTPDTVEPGSDTEGPNDPSDTTDPDDPNKPGDPSTVDPSTIKGIRTLAANKSCDPNGFVDVTPRAEVVDVVVTSEMFDQSSNSDPGGIDGYFLSDAEAGPWAGILLRVPRNARPATALKPGDRVTIQGRVTLAFCNAQLEANQIAITGSAPLPEPIPVVPEHIGDAFYGSLVSLKNVDIVPATEEGRGAKIKDTEIGFSFNFSEDYIDIKAGNTYDVTGFVTKRFENWQIGPRSASDVVQVFDLPDDVDLDTVAGLRRTADATSCDAEGFVDVFDSRQLKSVIINSPKFDQSSSSRPNSIDGYLVSDPTLGPWSSILLRVPADARPATDFVPGDIVDLEGKLLLAFCNAQIDVREIVKTGSQAPLQPIAISPSEMDEAYTYSLLTIEDATIVAGERGNSRAIEGTDILVDYQFSEDFIDAEIGKTYDITGYITKRFENWQIGPRSKDDLVPVGGGGPVTPEVHSIASLRQLSQQEGCDDDGFVDYLESVTLEEAIVLSPQFDQSPNSNPNSIDGYLITDQDFGPWSSIVIRIPADLRPSAPFQPGDTINVGGRFLSAFCGDQIEVRSVEKVSQGAPLAPLAIAVSEMGPAYASSLVKLDDVRVIAGANGRGFRVEGADITIAFDFAEDFIELEVGGVYNLTGYVTKRFENWVLNPRSMADVVLLSEPVADDTEIRAIQMSETSMNCAAGNAFVDGERDLSFYGVVTASNFAVSNKQAIVVSDGSTELFSGILVLFGSNNPPTFAVGDTVYVKGDHVEYYCMTQISDARVEHAVPPISLPESVVLPAGTTNLEPYEGMLVTLQDVQTGSTAAGGSVETQHGLLIDPYIMGQAFRAADYTNQTLASVTGIVIYSFDAFRVAPRSTDDLVSQ